MRYSNGSHGCKPVGSSVVYSERTYVMRHMNHLGLPYLLNKMRNRFDRSTESRKVGCDVHYDGTDEATEKRYGATLAAAGPLPEDPLDPRAPRAPPGFNRPLAM